MKKLNKKQFILFLSALFLVVSSIVYADVVNNSAHVLVTGYKNVYDSGEKNVQSGTPLFVYEVDPGDAITVTGTVNTTVSSGSWMAVGIGTSINGTPLGYFASDFPLGACSATGGSGGGNSTADGRICERTFNGPYSNSNVQATFTIWIANSAVRGSGPYRIGVASAQGNVVDEDFYIKIRTTPVPALSAKWTTSGTSSYTVTATPGQTITNIPFEFWNSGAPLSSVTVTGCNATVTSGNATYVYPVTCPSVTLNN